MAHIVALHGVATSSRLWEGFADRLPGHTFEAVDRPCSGSLDTELAWLAPRVEGAVVLGVSGGATLGLALVMSSVRLSGALLHEPAVGGLAPNLLAPMREAFATGGSTAFARALYGSGWSPTLAPALDDRVTAREVAMFSAFQPAEVFAGQGPVLVTTGSRSGPERHQAAQSLHENLGYPIATVADSGHLVTVDNPEGWLALLAPLLSPRSAKPTG